MMVRSTRMGGLVTSLVTLAASITCVQALRSNDPSANGTVVLTGNMSAARSGHTATLLPNGKVLITGGMERNGMFHATAELYDPGNSTFASAGSMTAQRICHTATLVTNGKVLLAGGIDHPYSDLATAELYDPATGKFTPTGSMTIPRCGHQTALLRDGKVLIVGGAKDADSTKLGSAELYDPKTGTFTATGSMSAPRVAHTVTLLKNGKVLVTGGAIGRYPNEMIFASAEIYDPAAGKFTPTGSMNIPRYKHAAVLLADGRVLITGGSDNRAWQGQYDSAELYDPATGRFTLTGKMNFKRFKLPSAVVLLRNGRVLVAGGDERVEIYDPATGTFTLAQGSLDLPAHFSTATLLPNGKVLLAGGYGNSDAATPHAWLYQP